MIAEFAPWPWWCSIACAASPSRTTESVCQRSTGSMSYTPRTLTLPTSSFSAMRTIRSSKPCTVATSSSRVTVGDQSASGQSAVMS
jgi:hypothetical protein